MVHTGRCLFGFSLCPDPEPHPPKALSGGSVGLGAGFVVLPTVAKLIALSSGFALPRKGKHAVASRLGHPKGSEGTTRRSVVLLQTRCSSQQGCRLRQVLWRRRVCSRNGPRGGPAGGRLRPKASRKGDLSCHYLRPVVTACSGGASGTGALGSLSGAPVQGLLGTARSLEASAAPPPQPHPPQMPIRYYTEVPHPPTPPRPASSFCWSLN